MLVKGNNLCQLLFYCPIDSNFLCLAAFTRTTTIETIQVNLGRPFYNRMVVHQLGYTVDV